MFFHIRKIRKGSGQMVRYIGSIEIPGFYLRYYVYGNLQTGYGIRIRSMPGETACYVVSRDLLSVFGLARRLMRCSVFPENLEEIIADFQYDCLPVDKEELHRYTKINEKEGSSDLL